MVYIASMTLLQPMHLKQNIRAANITETDAWMQNRSRLLMSFFSKISTANDVVMEIKAESALEKAAAKTPITKQTEIGRAHV